MTSSALSLLSPVADEAVPLTAEGEIPLHPPIDWFSDEAADSAPPKLTIWPNGLMAGVVAPAGRCLLDGSSSCWVVPRPLDGRGSTIDGSGGMDEDYRMAHVGSTVTAEGVEIPTAVLAGPGGHADSGAGPAATLAHYGDTACQIGRGRYVWSDMAGGIVFVGALWPEIGPRAVAAARASACSVDFRWIEDEARYRLIATCLVNVGALPSRYAAVLASGAPVLMRSAESGVASGTTSTEEPLMADDETTIESAGSPCADCEAEVAAPARMAAYLLEPRDESPEYGDQLAWPDGIGMFCDRLADITGTDWFLVRPQDDGALGDVVLIPAATAARTGLSYEWVWLDEVEDDAVVEAVTEEDAEPMVASLADRIGGGRRVLTDSAPSTRTERAVATLASTTEDRLAAMEASVAALVAAVMDTRAAVIAREQATI